MRLRHLGKTSQSEHGKSPALYLTDRGTAVVQGWKVTDAEAILDTRDLTDDEVLNEVPLDVLRLVNLVED